MKVINLHQEEQETIRLAVENNRPAQQMIYAKYAPKMLSVCRQYIKDIQFAEDLMITSFMKIFVILYKFENKGSFEGWMRRIMINECISYIRVHKKVSFLEDEFYAETGFDASESNYNVDEIQFMIDNLPEGYKLIFNLFAIDGYKHQEIATMLNISEGTSKSQLFQARKMLQEQIIKLKNYGHGNQ